MSESTVLRRVPETSPFAQATLGTIVKLTKSELGYDPQYYRTHRIQGTGLGVNTLLIEELGPGDVWRTAAGLLDGVGAPVALTMVANEVIVTIMGPRRALRVTISGAGTALVYIESYLGGF